MQAQVLILIPIAIIIYAWIKSLPPTQSFSKPNRYKTKAGKHAKTAHYAGAGEFYGEVFDGDSLWHKDYISMDDMSSDNLADDNNFATMSSMPSITEEMLDPAKSYLPYNIYHSDSFGIPDISVNDSFGMHDIFNDDGGSFSGINDFSTGTDMSFHHNDD